MRALTVIGAAALAAAYAAIWAFAGVDVGTAAQMWFIPLVGVFGAMIASATGAGGGIVYIPAFDALSDSGVVQISAAGVVASSFLIQCFGMSTGTLTWLNRLFGPRHPEDLDFPVRAFVTVIALALLPCVPGLLAAQRLMTVDPHVLLFWFKGFSLILGVGLLMSIPLRGTGERRHVLLPADATAVFILGAVGGPITAAFSIGVGEFIALYLLIRGYPLRATVAAAVVITCVTVIAGAPHHVVNGDVPWEVVALAAPGVVVGGFLARRAAYALGEKRLKVFAGLWIVGSSLYLMALNL